MIGTSKNIWGFDPRSVPGCSLWLDGADVSVLFSDVAGTSAITTNGQTIRCWKDKSGRGCNATQAGNAPIWNSSNCVNFTQTLGQSMNLPNGTLPFASGTNAYSIFAVASLNNTNSGLKTIIGNGVAGNNSFNALQIQTQSIANLWYSNDIAGGSLTANTFFIANIAFDGSTRYIYQTGMSVNTTASSGWAAPNTNNVIGVEPATGNWYYDGNIGEILVFNTALTTSQRQQIEGYLAWKWGLTTSIPSTHPFSSIRPHLRTFQPTDIPGCQLWLDAADSSSLVLSGSSVTQWNDKSGNGRNGTLFLNYPTYTTNRVNFNGTQGLATSLSPSTNIESGFVICGFTSVSSVNTLIGSVVNESGGRQFRVNNAIQTIKQDIVAVLTSGTSLENNTTYLCEYVNNGTILTHYLNGNSYASGVSVTYTAGGNITTIGYRSNNTEYNEGLYGYIQEVIIFNTALTTSQRQQVEGYLAQKWGLTPYLPVISPLSIPGCQLWLDGADPAGTGVTPSNGATVSTWVDKSLSGTVSTTASPPTFTSSGISFNGTSQYIQLSSAYTFTLSQGITLFTVSYLASNNGGFQRFFSVNEAVLPNGIVWGTQNGNFVADVGNSETWNNSGAWPLSPAVVNLSNTVLISGTFTTTSETFYANGTSNTTYGVTRYSPIIPYSIGSSYYNNNFQQFWNGRISEIIMYNSVLTTPQRQSIEGYLARKWGISISATLPSPHPFKSILPATAAHFYPTDIPGCSLWLDAADSSQVTFSSSSNVNTWIDKSGFNNSSSNQSLGTTITYPGTKVNGLNTVNFTAGCIRGAFNGSSVINTTDVTIFIVTAETAPNDNLRMFSLTPAANYQDDQASNMLIYCAPGNYQLTFFRGGAMPTPYTVTQNVPFIYSLTQTSGTGSMWLNGGSNRTASITTSAFAVTNYNIGTQYLANQNYTGLMCEVVVYNTLLNTSQRQKVEGYLAHKWGLTNSLPLKHPYKPSPPIFPPNLFFPTPSMYSALFNTANNSSLTIPANSALTLGTNNHTIEFWLYQTSRDQYNTSFSYGNTSLFATNNYFMNVGTYIGIVIGNGAGNWAINIDGGAVASLNTWHHYAFVRNGTTFTFYLNGINRGSATSSVNIPAQGDVFRIGNTTTYPINGYISNFRLVNGTAVYTSNFTPPTSPLTAIPNTQVLIQGLVDRGPNAFTVTNNGGVTLSTSVSPF